MVRAFLTGLLIALVPMSAVAQSSAPSPSSPESRIPDRGVDKTGVFVDSLALLGIEHGIRLAFQPGTRRELRGNFWRDYYRSVRVPTAWEDTDSWLVNYVGHPIHGAAAGYLWLEHDPKAPLTIEFDNRYWASRVAQPHLRLPTVSSSKLVPSAKPRLAMWSSSRDDGMG